MTSSSDQTIQHEAREILDPTTIVDDGEIFVARDGESGIACEIRAELTSVEAMRDLARRIDAAADRLEQLG